MRIEWDEFALFDRERIFEFLYECNPLAAEKADDEIDLAVMRLLTNPKLGIRWYGQGRKLIVAKASLLIFYEVFDNSIIRILAIAHQKENYP